MQSISAHALAVTGLMLAASPSVAESRIHVQFKNYYERVRPGYAAGIVDQDFDIRLSGKNEVQETATASNRSARQTWNFNNTLGDDRWKVLASNKLQKTERRRQSVRTTIITVDGDRCSATWNEELLPGFTEYYIYSIMTKSYAYYKQARMVSSQCKIVKQ
jgi:hypothetical protein